MEQNVKVMGLNEKILYWQGFWFEDPEPDLEFFLQYFNPRVAHLLVKYRFLRLTLNFLRYSFSTSLMVISLIRIVYLYPMGMIIFWDSKIKVLENVYALVIMFLLFLAQLNMLYKRGMFKYLISEQDRLSRSKLLDEEERNMLNRAQVLCRRITLALNHVAMPGIVVAAIIADVFYFGPNRMLFISEWYPWDISMSPAYEITLVARTIEIVGLLFQANTLTSATFCHVIFLETHFKILRHKLRNLRANAIKRITLKVLMEAEFFAYNTNVPLRGFRNNGRIGRQGPTLRGARPRGGRGALNARSTSNMPMLVPLYQADHVVFIDEGVEVSVVEESDGPTDALALQGITAEELDREMQMILAEIVELHVDLTKMTNFLRNMHNEYLILVFVSNVVIVALTTLIIFNSELTGATIFAIVMFTAEISSLHLVYNYLGSIVIDQNDAIRDEIYAIDWTGASPSFKRSMLVMMSRANVPLIIKPTGLDPLSLKNFGEVSKMAYKMISSMTSFVK